MSKVKPEDLRLANSVVGIKECSSGATKKNFWNGVHQLEAGGSRILLKTNDGSFWLRWTIPLEGEIVPFKALISHAAFEHAAKYLDGGSFELQRGERVLTLMKEQLRYPMREENPQDYPEPAYGENPIEWVCDTKPLVKALRFIAGFIDETSAQPEKSVATFYTDGFALAGFPSKFAILKGLTINSEMSFKSRTAKAVAQFLDRIGEKVKVKVSFGDNAKYVFQDTTGNYEMLVTAESGRFRRIMHNLDRRVDQVIHIDRKTLLQRCLAFAGCLQENQTRINLTFRGAKEQASLRVYTPGEDYVATDEFAVYRTVAEKENESPEEKEIRLTALLTAGQMDIAFDQVHLADTLAAMEGTAVTFKCCGAKLVLIEDEASEATGDNLPFKSVLLTAKQTREEKKEVELPQVVTPAPTTEPVAV